MMITFMEGQSEVKPKGKKKEKLPEGAHWAMIRGANVMVNKEGIVIGGAKGKFNGMRLKGKVPVGVNVGGKPASPKPGLKWNDLDRSGKGKFKKVRKDIMDALKAKAARKLEAGRR